MIVFYPVDRWRCLVHQTIVCSGEVHPGTDGGEVTLKEVAVVILLLNLHPLLSDGGDLI